MQIFCFYIRTNTKPAQFRDDISILGTMNTLLKIKMRRSVQAIKNSNRKHIFRLVIGVWTKACETNEVINVHFNKIEWNWCPTSTIHKQWRKQQRKINRYSVLCSTNSSNVIKQEMFFLSLYFPQLVIIIINWHHSIFIKWTRLFSLYVQTFIIYFRLLTELYKIQCPSIAGQIDWFILY